MKLGAEPTSPRPWVRRLALGLVLLSAAAALGTLIWGSRPVARVGGRVAGDPALVARVVIADPQRGVIRPGRLEGDRYVCGVPRAAREPQLVIHSEGRALVRSGVLILDERTELEVPPLGLWISQIRIREAEGTLHFDWVPIPKGEGYPEPRRYSLLVTYTKLDGRPGEASLLSREAAMTISRQELVDLLKDWDATVTAVDLSLRAFDPSVTAGPLWIAGERTWDLAKS